MRLGCFTLVYDRWNTGYRIYKAHITIRKGIVQDSLIILFSHWMLIIDL